jgi:hypothetical protein
MERSKIYQTTDLAKGDEDDRYYILGDMLCHILDTKNKLIAEMRRKF